jgi:REP element-mobilizing transposase RayT
MWLSVLTEVCAHHNFVVHSYCQMSNHYHIVVETVDGNLSRGMHQLNGMYSQYFNRRHNLVGHVFQGRYKAVLIQRVPYLMEVARYVVLNPVRAGTVNAPGDWPWSSYAYLLGNYSPPPWLEVTATLQAFSNDPVLAVAAYRRFVMAGIGASSPLLKTRHQLILGDDAFGAAARPAPDANTFRAVPKLQRRAFALSLPEYQLQARSRSEAMCNAYHSTAYTMEQIGAFFGVSSKTVSRAIKKHRTR